MKKYNYFSHHILMGLVLTLAIVTSQLVHAQADDHHAAQLPLADIRLFTDIYARIKQEYVEEVDDKTLLEGAIRGMMSSLDPHSVYLSSDAFEELKIGTKGEFGGLGIEVGMENGLVRVIAPIEGTPADKAGVKAGDMIIKLDETVVKGLTLNDAVKLMRGKRGTDILLTIMRDGEIAPLEITVTRDVITVKSVRSRELEPGYGYLRISSFQAKTTRNVIDAIQKFNRPGKERLQGLVLDLRNNPGGVLTGAVGVSDVFLNDGQMIVYTKGRGSDGELSYKASTPDMMNNIPIVILINEGSASASEIVAGALQDHGRAIVMGKTSFGKGSVQTVLPLQANNGIKLTTSRYYTPDGHSIQAQGIEPDILVEEVVEQGAVDKSFRFVRESDLEGHLENNQSSENQSASEQPVVKKITVPADSDNDAVLDEALNVLKDLSQQQQLADSRTP